MRRRGTVDGKNVAVLWREGCAACGFTSLGPEPSSEILNEQNGRLHLQPVSVVGDFPNDFTIQFQDRPPDDIVGTFVGYATGALVLTTLAGNVDYERDGGFDSIGFSFPLLFDDDRAALGVTSMMPIYVGFATPDGNQDDQNITGKANQNAPLSPGYHIGRHDGVVTNANIANFVCTQTLSPAVKAQMDACFAGEDGTIAAFQAAVACSDAISSQTCGSAPDAFAPVHEVTGASLSVTIDGSEDLVNALAGVTLAEIE